MNDGAFEIVLAGLVLLGRLGDILSTRMATPKLVAEANPLVRRLGWRFAMASLLLVLVPFYNTAMGLVVLVPSLLVSASNLGRAWVIRAIGETEYFDILKRAAQRSPRWIAQASVAGSAAFLAMAAMVLWYLSGSSLTTWGGIFAAGILTYAAAILLHGSFFIARVYRAARHDLDRTSAV